MLPAVIALIAENTGHVKAVAEMTETDLDPVMGRAIAADGVGTVLASVGRRLAHHHVRGEHRGDGGDPGLLHGRVLRGRGGRDPVRALVPSSERSSTATPGAVLGGVTVVLYGMIGLLGAKIWAENRVDFANPLNLVPLAAGLIIGIGNVSLEITEDFTLSGIALGTIVTIAGLPPHPLLRPAASARERRYGGCRGATGGPPNAAARDGARRARRSCGRAGAYKEP